MYKIVCLEKKIKDFKVLQKSMEGVADRFDLVRFDSTMKVLSYLVDNVADAVFLAKDSEEMETEILVDILRKIDNDLGIVLVSDNKADAYKVM